MLLNKYIDSPLISILIIVNSDRASLACLLDSLVGQICPESSYEVIIVDYQFDNAIQQLFSRYDKERQNIFKYVCQNNRNLTITVNDIVRMSKSNLIAFLEPGCVVANSWVKEITQGCNSKQFLGTNGKVSFDLKSFIYEKYRFYLAGELVFNDSGKDINYLSLLNISFKKESLILVGGFNEKFISFRGAVQEIICRLKKKNILIRYNPKAVIFNLKKSDILAFSRLCFQFGVDRMLLNFQEKSGSSLTEIIQNKKKVSCLKLFLMTVCLLVNALFYVSKIFLDLSRVPFRVLFFYGVEGLSVGSAFYSAYLEFFNNLFFRQGCIVGCFISESRGLINIF